MHRAERATMAHSHFDRFLQEATAPDLGPDCTLAPDPLYGLYVSWCQITSTKRRTEKCFRIAMRSRVGAGPNGLRMTGPAAADYFLASYPRLT
jgi:hypothetical protein